jgi:molybdenum cofactor cytidylyltransferase
MGTINKLLSVIGDVSLVRLSAARAVACKRGPVIVVTGHMADEISEEVSGLPVTLVHNDEYASGLSSSIRRALQAVNEDCVGILIHLADMPLVRENHFIELIDAFERHNGEFIVRATAFGDPGNPVVLPRSLFADLLELEGDGGARRLIAKIGIPVTEVEIGRAASCDVDTPAALEAAGGRLP